MSIRHRFFIAKPVSPLHDRLLEIVELRREAAQAIKAFVNEIGATAVYGNTPDSYLFDFASESDVDRKTWSSTKPIRGTYYFRPRKNTPEGKTMAARIAQLPVFPSADEALTLTGLPVGFPCVIEGGKGYSPFIKLHTRALTIVSTPWRDVDPAKLAAYVEQANSEKRHSWCASLDYAQWQPPAWLTEIKEWEALKIIEEVGSHD